MITDRIIRRIKTLADNQNTSTMIYGKQSYNYAIDRVALNSFMNALELTDTIDDYEFEYKENIICKIRIYIPYCSRLEMITIQIEK